MTIAGLVTPPCCLRLFNLKGAGQPTHREQHISWPQLAFLFDAE